MYPAFCILHFAFCIEMSEVFLILAFFVLWFVLQVWLLPRLGVPT
jgi:hypothetical protein